MYRDFLRHIINPKLSQYGRRKRYLIGVLDEVRKLIASAEDRYGFSVYGGNPVNLVKYFNSSDFDLVVSVLKSANALDILEDILKEVIKTYSDLPEVVQAASKKLHDIERGIVSTSEVKIIVENIEKKLASSKVSIIDDRVEVEYDGFKAYLVLIEDRYRVLVNISLDKVFDNYIDAINYLEKIYKSIK